MKQDSKHYMENASLYILISGLARKLDLTPHDLNAMLDEDRAENRRYWNELVAIRKKRK